jgi:hypothetical protein
MLISLPIMIPTLVGLGYLTNAVFNIDNCGCDVSGNKINEDAINLLKTLPTSVFANGNSSEAIKSIPTIGITTTNYTSDKRINLSTATLGLSKMALIVVWLGIVGILLFCVNKIF